MLALLVPAALTGALAGPSFLIVSRLSTARPFAPLVRGSVERLCVLAGSGVAAISISAQFIFALFWLSPPLAGVELWAAPAFFLFAPPVLGLAPWVAGEVLSGPSRRQEESLAAALAAAYLFAALAFGAFLSAGLVSALLAAAAAATVAPAFAYLSVRGPETSRLPAR